MRRRGPVAFKPILRRPAGFLAGLLALLWAASIGGAAAGTERGMKAQNRVERQADGKNVWNQMKRPAMRGAIAAHQPD